MNPNRNKFNFNSIMSRRKQSNPKPLLKRDDEEFPNEENATQNNIQNEDTDGTAAAEEQSTHSEPSKANTPESNENSETNEQQSRNESEKRPLERDERDDDDSISPQPAKRTGLRLNTALASDPATNPDAKELMNFNIKSEESKALDDGDDDVDHEFINHNEDTESIIEAVSIPKPPLNLKSPQPQHHHHHQTTQKAKENINNVNQMLVKNLEMIPRQNMNVFMCTPCGIRFSSLSTLEAHQTYYCSHRKDADENNQKTSNNSSDVNGTEPPTKSIKTGKQYACTQCSYSADKKVSLNRHMRMHQTSPAPSSTTSNGDDPPPSQSQIIVPQIIGTPQIIDRYCSDCDIRFSSTKTYRAHKQHYCSSRHQGQATPVLPAIPNVAVTPKPSISKSSESQTPPETSKSPPTASQPFLAIPTNPIIIIPYSLIRSASIIPGPLSSPAPVTNPESACFMLQNGTLQPIAYSLTTTAAAATTPTPPNQSQQQQQQQLIQAPRTPHNETKTCKPSGSGNEVLKAINKRDGIVNREVTTTPLDLSIRRMSPAGSNSRERSLSLSSAISAEHFRMEFDTMMEGKENLSNSGDSLTPEQIVCAPSLPGSPPLTPSRRSNSPRGSSVSMSPNSSTSHSILMRPLLPADIALRLSDPTLNVIPPLVKQSMELALRLSTTAAASNTNEATNTQQISPSQPIASTTPTQIPAQIFVKTGMSKCKECNIVFCKYENYVAHKKHYCSARNLEDSEGNSKISPPISPPSVAATTTAALSSIPQTYQQLICMACGIKFGNLDNLNAHQMYYCPKRNELQTSSLTAAAATTTTTSTPIASSHKEKCIKCKSVHDPSQNCTVAGQGAYKCPICDVISPNSSEARRHMETHGGVKAFRCTICRYKGNTLRGMRTHIRMHIDKKSGDVNEENYISCILDDDSTEIPPLAAASKIPSPHVIENVINNSVLKPAKLIAKSPEIETPVIVDKNVIKIEPEEDIDMSDEISKENDDSIKERRESPIIANNVIKMETDENDLPKHSSPPQLVSPKIVSSSPLNENHSPLASSMIKLNSTTPPTIESPNSNIDSKYCSNCDISFTYTHTFIAHKKFYCKGKNGDHKIVDHKSPSPNASVVNVTLSAEAISHQV